MVRKILKLIGAAFFIGTLASCASTEVEQQPAPVAPAPEPQVEENEVPVKAGSEATVTKHYGTMMWEIKGLDKNGNNANIFLFGTIEAADNRIYPVGDNVISALKHADRVFSELSLNDFKNAKNNDKKRDGLAEKNNVDYDSDKNIFSVMSKEECQWLLDNMGMGVLVYSVIEPFEVYDSLFDFQMKKTGLTADKENKSFFYNKSGSLGKTVEALEGPEGQGANIGKGAGSRQEQINSVKDFIDAHIKYPDLSANTIKKLYQAYVVGDDVTFSETLNVVLKNNKDLVSVKDNNAMADKIGEILAGGGSSFIFADITRLVGDDSVFSVLRNKGIIK